MMRICDNIRVEESQGAYWSVFEDGDRCYRSTTPCNTPEEAIHIGRVQALKAEAQQDSNPVVLAENGYVIYFNLKAQELGVKIGDRLSSGTINKSVEGIDYVWFA